MDRTYYSAKTWIDDRNLNFQAIEFQARLRITVAVGNTEDVQESEPLGSVICLDTDSPGLRISAPLQAEWASLHYEAIIAEAKRIWQNIHRECQG